MKLCLKNCGKAYFCRIRAHKVHRCLKLTDLYSDFHICLCHYTNRGGDGDLDYDEDSGGGIPIVPQKQSDFQ